MDVVVIEEAVQSSTVDEDWVRVEDAETPARSAGGEDRVVVCCDSGEGVERVRVGLVVCGLGLDESHKDVTSVDQLVLVQGVMLDSGSVKPDLTDAGFDEESTAGVDADLGERKIFNIVIRSPEPYTRKCMLVAILGV